MRERQGTARWTVTLATLAILSLAVFYPVGSFDFIILDDYGYVVENPYVSKGLSMEGLRWILSFPEISYWHPLTWLSLMLDVELFGKSAGAMHLVNVLLHGLSAILLFLLLYRMTLCWWRSAFVAALFTVHPINVESVAWVTERKNVLSAVFWMLTILFYIRYAEKPSTGRMTRLSLVFLLGLLAKVSLIVLPFVLLLLDFWPLRRFDVGQEAGSAGPGSFDGPRPASALVSEKIPLFLLAVLAGLVAVVPLSLRGYVTQTLAFPYRLANAATSYVTYIAKGIWPHRLAVFYPHQGIDLAAWKWAGATLIIVALLTFVTFQGRRRPYLLTGSLWFFGSLVPIIGLLQTGPQSHADRFVYMPMIGLFIAAVWTVSDLVEKKPALRMPVLALALAVLGLYAAAAQGQVRRWQNSMTLFSHALEVTSENWMAHENLGLVHLQSGENAEAVRHLTEAARINPLEPRVLVNCGLALAAAGRHGEALAYFREAVKIDPEDAKAQSNLGTALAMTGKIGESLPHFLKARELAPGEGGNHLNVGLALAGTGRPEEAVASFREALRRTPGDVRIHLALARALRSLGRHEETESHSREAARLGGR